MEEDDEEKESVKETKELEATETNANPNCSLKS